MPRWFSIPSQPRMLSSLMLDHTAWVTGRKKRSCSPGLGKLGVRPGIQMDISAGRKDSWSAGYMGSVLGFLPFSALCRILGKLLNSLGPRKMHTLIGCVTFWTRDRCSYSIGFYVSCMLWKLAQNFAMQNNNFFNSSIQIRKVVDAVFCWIFTVCQLCTRWGY